MSMQSTGSILQSRREDLIGGSDRTPAGAGLVPARVAEMLGSVQQDRPVHSRGVRGLLHTVEPPTMRNGTVGTRRVEEQHRLQPSHDPLNRQASRQPSETHAGGLMVFDHKGRLVMANAYAELTMAALGVELNRGGRLRIDALGASDAKGSGVDGELPEWLDPKWIEPVIEGNERLGTVVQIPESRRSRASTQGGLPAYKLRQVIEFIHAHIDQPISLTQLASVAALSPFHFHREFKRSTGLTPGKYILEVRIKRAETLLSDTDLPLAQVAVQVGFADQSHFTVAFRRATSMTPRTYRNATAKSGQPQGKSALVQRLDDRRAA